MRAIIPFEAPPSQLLILLTINWTLVWWLRSSLNNSGVIPANPGSESGVARAGIQEFQRLLDTGFRRYDGEDLNDLFNELWFQDTSMCSQCDYLPIPKVSLYSLVNSLKLGPTISGLTTR